MSSRLTIWLTSCLGHGVLQPEILVPGPGPTTMIEKKRENPLWIVKLLQSWGVTITVTILYKYIVYINIYSRVYITHPTHSNCSASRLLPSELPSERTHLEGPTE